MGYQKINDHEYEWMKQEIQKRIDEKNTDIFCAINRIGSITKVLSENAKGTIFLNNRDFKKLYPALISKEFQNSKVNLIVSAEVLLDEKKETPFTFFLEDRFIQLKQEKAPSLQDLPNPKRIFIADSSVQCDSFMIFNNKSYILKIENAEQPYFSCALNATYSKSQSKRLEMLLSAMIKIKSLSVPFQDVQKKISQHHKKNRLDDSHERE